MTSKQYYLQRIANLEDMVGALIDDKAALETENAELKKPKPKEKKK